MLPLGKSISVKECHHLSRVAKYIDQGVAQSNYFIHFIFFFAKILHISKYPITFAAHLRKNNILP